MKAGSIELLIHLGHYAGRTSFEHRSLPFSSPNCSFLVQQLGENHAFTMNFPLKCAVFITLWLTNANYVAILYFDQMPRLFSSAATFYTLVGFTEDASRADYHHKIRATVDQCDAHLTTVPKYRRHERKPWR